MQTGETLS